MYQGLLISLEVFFSSFDKGIKKTYAGIGFTAKLHV